MAKLTKKQARRRRHNRLRKSINGTAERPRMSAFVSNTNTYIQFIDDDAGRTLAAVSTLSSEFKEAGINANNMQGAETLGTIAASKVIALGINTVVFDRGGFAYHGRIKALADSARKNGLKF